MKSKPTTVTVDRPALIDEIEQLVGNIEMKLFRVWATGRAYVRGTVNATIESGG